MKKLIIVFLTLIFSTVAYASESPWDKPLPFQSGMITYKISGTMTGKTTLYIKDYGKRQVEFSDTTMKMFGMTQVEKSMTFTDPDWIHTVNQADNTGTKQANPEKFLRFEYDNLSSKNKKKFNTNVEKLGLSTIETMQGKIIKNATTIQGYSCDKVSIMETTAYVISGTNLPLKVDGDTMGMVISQNAEKIQKGNPPSAFFKLPTNIHFDHDQTTDDMMADQARTTVQNIVSGTSPSIAGSQQPDHFPNASDSGVYPVQQPPQPPAPPEQKSQTQQVLEDDASDVGHAAKDEAKDAIINETRNEVRSLFESIF